MRELYRNTKKRIFKESKQVGVLYHFCSLKDFYKYINKDDVLKPSGLFYNRRIKNNNAISMTRNPNLRLDTLRSFDVILRIEIDGDLLSESNSVLPYSARGVSAPVLNDDDYDFDEMEEITDKPIKDFHKYIRGFLIIIKREDIEPSDLIDKYSSCPDERDYMYSLREYIRRWGISPDKIVIKKGNRTITLPELLLSEYKDDIEKLSADTYNQRFRIREIDDTSLFNLLYDIANKDEDKFWSILADLGNYRLSKDEREKLSDIAISVEEKLIGHKLTDYEIEGFRETFGLYD